MEVEKNVLTFTPAHSDITLLSGQLVLNFFNHWVPGAELWYQYWHIKPKKNRRLRYKPGMFTCRTPAHVYLFHVQPTTLINSLYRFRVVIGRKKQAWASRVTSLRQGSAHLRGVAGKGGKGGGGGGGGGGVRLSLVRQEITQPWVWTSFIQTNRSTILVWAPCVLTFQKEKRSATAVQTGNVYMQDTCTRRWFPQPTTLINSLYRCRVLLLRK